MSLPVLSWISYAAPRMERGIPDIPLSAMWLLRAYGVIIMWRDNFDSEIAGNPPANWSVDPAYPPSSPNPKNQISNLYSRSPPNSCELDNPLASPATPTFGHYHDDIIDGFPYIEYVRVNKDTTVTGQPFTLFFFTNTGGAGDWSGWVGSGIRMKPFFGKIPPYIGTLSYWSPTINGWIAGPDFTREFTKLEIIHNLDSHPTNPNAYTVLYDGVLVVENEPLTYIPVSQIRCVTRYVNMRQQVFLDDVELGAPPVRDPYKGAVGRYYSKQQAANKIVGVLP